FQPNPHIGLEVVPLMNRKTCEGSPGKGCTPVGMQRALDSAIGLPSSSTSASWMLGLLMPEEQRRNLTMPPVSFAAGETSPCAYRSVRGRDWQTTENSSASARFSLTASGVMPEHSYGVRPVNRAGV